jgi:hypothetical protein
MSYSRAHYKMFLPLIVAFAEGKQLQYKPYTESTEWMDLKEEEFPYWSADPNLWRIKPEPREYWVVDDLGTDGPVYVYRTPPTHVNSKYVRHVREVL